MNNKLIECLKIVPAIVPIDTTGAAANGDWCSLKNWRRCIISIAQGAWAGGTPAVTLEQATTAAGGSSKALDLEEYWSHVALTSDTLTRTAVTSDTFNLTATANTHTQIEIHAQDLDHENSFTFFRVAIASPGANADLIHITYVFGDPVFTGKPTTLPTVIA